jgi:hypothetical protein
MPYSPSSPLVMLLTDAVNRYGLCATVSVLADITYAFSRFHEEPHGKGFWRESGEALHSARRILSVVEQRHCASPQDGLGPDSL